MAAGSDNHLVYVTLVLAAAAAVATTPADSAQSAQKLQWLLSAIAVPDSLAVADANAEIMPVSP